MRLFFFNMSVEIQVDPMNMEKGKSAWALEWKIIESM